VGEEARPFGDRFAEAVTRLGALCAGIDPMAELLEAWGLPDDASGLARFVGRCLEAYVGVVPIVKPQVAFFERHGSAGLAVLEELMTTARDAGLLVLADAKRGDISTTAAGYADAWLGDGPLAADAVTAVAYLGLDALGPLLEEARARGRGVFVVVRSSNPEGRLVQEAATAAGPSVEAAMLALLAADNDTERRAPGGPALGSLGAVVGVIHDDASRLEALPVAQLGGPILVPGIGAQGATVVDAARLFAGCPPGSVVVNESRALLRHGPSVPALRAAAASTLRELAEVFA
jgi:orotidine-5'-phosphate decarboxylase